MGKILIVDDSEFSRNSIKRALGHDYTYFEASNGTEGLELFKIKSPDFVILDLTMPDMNGLEVLEKIIKLDKSARVLINSADIQDYNKEKAFELGAIGFINKPVKEDILRDQVAKNIRKGG